MGSRSKFRGHRKTKAPKAPVDKGTFNITTNVPGADFVSAESVVASYVDLYGRSHEPSAIDLLGDLAVSERERELRIKRRTAPLAEWRFAHFDMVANPTDPDCVVTAVPDLSLDMRERRS